MPKNFKNRKQNITKFGGNIEKKYSDIKFWNIEENFEKT